MRDLIHLPHVITGSYLNPQSHDKHNVHIVHVGSHEGGLVSHLLGSLEAGPRLSLAGLPMKWGLTHSSWAPMKRGLVTHQLGSCLGLELRLVFSPGCRWSLHSKPGTSLSVISGHAEEATVKLCAFFLKFELLSPEL